MGANECRNLPALINLARDRDVTQAQVALAENAKISDRIVVRTEGRERSLEGAEWKISSSGVLIQILAFFRATSQFLTRRTFGYQGQM